MVFETSQSQGNAIFLSVFSPCQWSVTLGSDSPSSGLLLVTVSLVFAMARRLAVKVVPGPRVFDEEKQKGFDRGEYDMSAYHVTQ